ncbi:MAG: hypothetical protein M1398_07495, partial [Deltaproteobacteria bacterium]|nr:hypothetical protein [Deltaproteobacteria bacterium]
HAVTAASWRLLCVRILYMFIGKHAQQLTNRTIFNILGVRLLTCELFIRATTSNRIEVFFRDNNLELWRNRNCFHTKTPSIDVS